MAPPSKRARKVVEKKQTGWFGLPNEMRRKILDSVEIEDLIKFSDCSKQCREEVWKSKNYFNEIYLDETDSAINMKLGPSADPKSYTINFRKESSKATNITFTASVSERKKSRKVREQREGVVLKYLQLFLRRIGPNLRVLRINLKNPTRNWIVEHVKIRNLKKLDELTLGICSQHPGTVRKSERGHKTCPLDMEFVDMEQLVLIKKRLGMVGMNMTLERLLEIKTDHIFISYNSLSPEDVNKYIKMWMDGELHTNFKSLKIDVAGAESRTPGRHIGYDFLKGLKYTPHCVCCGLSTNFNLKSSCESLKHLTARCNLNHFGKSFELVIKDDDDEDVGGENDDVEEEDEDDEEEDEDEEEEDDH